LLNDVMFSIVAVYLYSPVPDFNYQHLLIHLTIIPFNPS